MSRLPTLCLASALLVPAADASAQHTVSLLGGMNLTVIANHSMDDTYLVGFERATGANLGVAASYMLSPTGRLQTLSVQLAGTYSQKGAALGSAGDAYRLVYLELALLAEAKFRSIVDGVYFRVLVGPALGRLQSCQRDFAATDDRPAETNPCEEGEFRGWDHAVVGGGGLEFRFTDRLWVTTSFLYTIGLGYIDNGEEQEDGDLKNRALTLRAGLSMPIG